MDCFWRHSGLTCLSGPQRPCCFVLAFEITLIPTTLLLAIWAGAPRHSRRSVI